MQEGADRSRWRLAKAEEILRVKLGNKASKAAARVLPRKASSASSISADGKLGAMVEVNCETDFVAKNDEFLALVQNVAELVATRIRPTWLRCLRCRWATVTVEVHPQGAGRQDRRKHVASAASCASKPRASCRVHPRWFQDRRADRPRGRRRSSWQGSGDAHRRVQAEVADASGVSAELLDTERRIAIEKAREAGKPEAMLEKIAEGTVQKFLKDVTLLDQVFVKAEDGKQTIEQLLKAKGASVAGFTLFIVGEGIEKKLTDFAAEVAAQAAAAAQK
jgi:elongation factor Ts